MRLRRLTPRGVETFRTFLQSIREGGEFQDSPAILYVDELSTPLEPRIEIEPRRFRRRLDAAEYLARVLEPIHTPALANDVGLWSWLALFYFDQLAPRREDGKRRPREDYHYIPSSGGSGWQADRHLLATPYRLHREHGEPARLLLHTPLHQHGQFVYQLTFRRDLITNRGFLEAMDLLYWDAAKKKPKRGVTTASRPGNLRRLITVLQQLDFNYDLQGMSAGEILELLPAEFDAWMPPPMLREPRPSART